MEFLRFVLNNTDPWIVILASFAFGIMIALSVSGAITHDDESTALEVVLIWAKRACLIMLLTGLPIFAIVLYVVAYKYLGYELANQYMGRWFGSLKTAFGDLWWRALPLVALPYFIKLTILRWVRPKISQLWREWGVMQTGDAPSDIRTEYGRLKTIDFNPQNYYSKDKHFWGLDEEKQPIYTPVDLYVKTHIKALGPSQTGKGVMLGVELDQAIWRGWGAWFIDQKPDDFIFDIMRESAERNGRGNIVICDLNGIGPGGYHPFKNGTIRERRERVVKALGLADSGTDADHYKKNARLVLDALMPHWDGTLSHLDELLKFPPNSLDKKEKANIINFGDNIRSPLLELRAMPALEPQSDALDIEKALSAGSIVYIKSDMQDSVVRKAAICLLEEIIQVVRRVKIPTYCKLTIDEARFMMTDTLANSLATVLSKKLLMTLAYQSVNDPLNLTDKTLNGESIKNGIETNTQTTIAYRPTDFETAEWISNPTGQIQKTVTKIESIGRNEGGAEEWTGERSVGQLEENLITTNQLFAMPARVGVIIRPGEISKILFTCWVPIKDVKGMPKKSDAVQETLPTENSPSSATSSSQVASSTSVANNAFAVAPALPAATIAAPELIGEDPFADDTSLDMQASDESGQSTESEGLPYQANLANSETPGEDPFADEDGFPASISGDTPAIDSAASLDDGPAQPSKADLAAMEAAIEAAASSLLMPTSKPATKKTKQATKPASDAPDNNQPTRPRVDLSSLDNIDGI